MSVGSKLGAEIYPTGLRFWMIVAGKSILLERQAVTKTTDSKNSARDIAAGFFEAIALH